MNQNAQTQPLLTKEEHQQLLEQARKLEAIQDEGCKKLKCSPEEMHLKINKVLTHIQELEAEVIKVEQVNKNKH